MLKLIRFFNNRLLWGNLTWYFQLFRKLNEQSLNEVHEMIKGSWIISQEWMQFFKEYYWGVWLKAPGLFEAKKESRIKGAF